MSIVSSSTTTPLAARANVITHVTAYYLRSDATAAATVTDDAVRDAITKAATASFAGASAAAAAGAVAAPLNRSGAAKRAAEEGPAAATALPPSPAVVVCPQDASFIESVWGPAKGDFHSAIADSVNPYARFTALVVVEDANSKAASAAGGIAPIVDGEIVYALHERQIPVLRVVITDANGDTNNKVADSVPSSSPSSASVRTHAMLRTVFVSGSSASTSSSSSSPSSLELQITAAVSAFFSLPALQGRVIVLEGGDGAGKQTQVALLRDRLAAEGFPTETLDYPNDAAGYGVMIRELLSGKFGNIREVNPLIFAALYGLNRHSTLPLLRLWLQRGANIVLDRYMTANYGHQASKYDKDAERIAAIETLRNFELGWLGLPDADRVFYLNLPPDFALRAMQSDATRRTLDMHELAGIEYKNNVRRSFLWCCGTFADVWAEVPCVNEAETERYSRAEVHERIFASVAPLLVNGPEATTTKK